MLSYIPEYTFSKCQYIYRDTVVKKIRVKWSLADFDGVLLKRSNDTTTFYFLVYNIVLSYEDV